MPFDAVQEFGIGAFPPPPGRQKPSLYVSAVRGIAAFPVQLFLIFGRPDPKGPRRPGSEGIVLREDGDGLAITKSLSPLEIRTV